FLTLAEVGQQKLKDIPVLGPAYYLAMKGIAPFINIPTNVTKWAIHQGPLAPLSARFYQRLAKGGAEAQLAMAEVTLGSLFLATMAGLALEGVNTGQGPTTSGQKKMWEADGNQRDSINFPGGGSTQYSRVDPFGLMAGWSADVVDISGHYEEADLAPLLGTMALAITRPMADKTYVRTLTQGLKAWLSKDPRGMEQFFKGRAGALSPGFGWAFRKKMAPSHRHIATMLDGFKNQLPWFSQDLPPDTDPLGRPTLTGRPLGPPMVRAFGLLNPIN